MPRYSVRPLGPDDFDLLMGLEAEMFGEDADGTLGPYYVRLCCEVFGDESFLLEASGRPAGYLLSFTKGRSSYCTTLAVLPRFQGSRAVVQLLKAYVQAIMHRADVCWFTVEPGNEAARALHRVLGAQEVETKPDYYGPGRSRILAKIDRSAFERLRHRFARLGLVGSEAPRSGADPEAPEPEVNVVSGPEAWA